jgi:hypothetical protein
LRGRDMQLGLTPGGAAIGALTRAARTIDLPLESTARFAVEIDAEGRATAISRTFSTGGDSAWNTVATMALAALRQQPGRKGPAIVEIEIVTRYRNPSGTKPGAPVGVGEHSEITFDVTDIGAVAGRQLHGRVISWIPR